MSSDDTLKQLQASNLNPEELQGVAEKVAELQRLGVLGDTNPDDMRASMNPNIDETPAASSHPVAREAAVDHQN